MDDPGTLIYVAFLVISLIAGWVKNNNKKKNQEASAPQPPPSVVTDIDIKKAMREKEAADRKAKEMLRSLAEQSNEAELERKSVKPNIQFAESDENTKSRPADLTNDESHGFDARKAFIYSEIFNAPYI